VVDVEVDGDVVEDVVEPSEVVVESPEVLVESPELVDDVVDAPGSPPTDGGTRLDGARIGAVPPVAMAICLGLSSFGLSLTSVPFMALTTCEGALPPVLTAGGEGGPPPGGVTENCPGGTGTVLPPEENSTWPWVPILEMPLTPFTWNTMK
jgi:hypothetical protein